LTEVQHRLQSWRPGPVRDALTGFLDAAREVAPRDRVACFDNDGTLWCERPSYVQLDFFIDALRTRSAEDPSIGSTAEFAALLAGDKAAMGELGLTRIAMALVGLFAGVTPEAFTDQVREYLDRATHPTLGRPVRATRYRPMLELISALKEMDFTICLVTGGGTEFVRAISQDLYGVPPEAVVGTMVTYTYSAEPTGTDGVPRPVLRRATGVSGDANEGPAKVSNIQAQLGRRPIFAAGNSAGDRQMLEWAAAGEAPSLALLVDHDDDAREFRYVGTPETFSESEPITGVARREGWTVVSMATDWATVFDDADSDGSAPRFSPETADRSV
jgi:phosphoglycolate phosphatase-like HAD superfamily hydrolase